MKTSAYVFFFQCEERLKEQYYAEREEAGKLTQAVTNQSRDHLKALARIRQVVKKTGDDRDTKLTAIEQLIDYYLPNEETMDSLQKRLVELEKINRIGGPTAVSPSGGLLRLVKPELHPVATAPADR